MGALKVKGRANLGAEARAVQRHQGKFFQARGAQQGGVVLHAFAGLRAGILRHEAGYTLQFVELQINILSKFVSSTLAHFAKTGGDVLRQVPRCLSGVFAHDHKQCCKKQCYAENGCECAAWFGHGCS